MESIKDETRSSDDECGFEFTIVGEKFRWSTGRRLHEGVYEVDDNATFGAACADAWVASAR